MTGSGERWRKQQVRRVERAQDACVDRAVRRTDRVLAEAVDFVWEAFERTGGWLKPPLNGLGPALEDFYRHVITSAYHVARDQKPGPAPKPIRLAKKKGPKGIPKSLKDLQDVFADRRYWPAVMKRSKAQADRLRKTYLKKLEQRFKKLLPRVVGGEISPAEAKAELREAWGASRARVKTIFQTETTNYFAKTQRAYFAKDPEIIGFLFDSVKDRARTDICRSRHGMVLRPNTKELTENTPALHWNCRSHLIPLVRTPANQKLLDDPSRQPSNRTLADLPPGWRK